MMSVKSRSESPVTLVYVLAASHSGSTLLSMLTGSHREICTVGELKLTSLGDVSQYRCSCRQIITQCPFWNGIKSDLAKRGIDFNIGRAGTDIRYGADAYIQKLLQPLVRGPLLELVRDLMLGLSPRWRRNLASIQSRNSALIHAIAAKTGCRVIVDSSKIGIRLKYLLRNKDIEIKVIRLIRDGRGVALTYVDPARFADARDPNFRGGGTGGSREKERLSVFKAAREWRRSNEEAEALLQRVPVDQKIEVRYEALCRDTNKTMERIFRFVGVDPVNWQTDFKSIDHHVVGNGMRLDTTSQVKLDERWKAKLTNADLRIFEKAAGALNRKLGYQ